MKKIWWVSFIALITVFIACSGGFKYPETAKLPVTDNYHGTEITDNYRWLEDGAAPEVAAWVAAQEKLTHKMLDHLPQKQWLIDHYNKMLRVDDEGVPRSLPDGDRMFKYTKAADQDKWVYNTKSDCNAAWKVLIDPNAWEETETLAGPVPSRDGNYLAYGVAHGGDENPIYRVMNLETGEHLPDSLLGWKQYVTSWLPDNSGFYYSAKPLAGDVPEGEEYYWPSAYFHELGTPATEDKKVFSHDEVKEYWHNVSISEEGQWEIYSRSLFNVNEVYMKAVGSKQDPIPLATGMDAEYSVDIVGNQILIKTDATAPLFMVYKTDVKKPQRKYWEEFIPQHEKDKLKSINPIGGHIYALYEHNAYSLIRIYDLKGNNLREIELPMIGSASVSGLWSRPDVWVTFKSYTYPKTIFRYSFKKDELEEYWRYPTDIQFEDFVTEQVWYPS
ncbi:hypothetical protein KKA08_05805, partial [bacterium]|nr:hypothetical protein [bacterium]